ncbi:siderophore-interacting protein [Corynebacterium sp. 335C]
MARQIHQSIFTVLSSEEVGPHMLRLRFSVDSFEPFAASGNTDAYVKLCFDDDGTPHVPEGAPGEGPRPVLRTYTVHSIDAEAKEVSVDFVVHGDEGFAAPWAARAQAGDRIGVYGPGGKYSPDETADWHLFVGDDTALPAITSAIRALGEYDPVEVVIESLDPERDLPVECHHCVHWLPQGEVPGEALVDYVQNTLPWRDGRVDVFAHGEAHAMMKRLRPWFIKERGVDRKTMSLSGYWRVGRAEEAFRQWKQENKPEDD